MHSLIWSSCFLNVSTAKFVRLIPLFIISEVVFHFEGFILILLVITSIQWILDNLIILSNDSTINIFFSNLSPLFQFFDFFEESLSYYSFMDLGTESLTSSKVYQPIMDSSFSIGPPVLRM